MGAIILITLVKQIILVIIIIMLFMITKFLIMIILLMAVMLIGLLNKLVNYPNDVGICCSSNLKNRTLFQFKYIKLP